MTHTLDARTKVTLGVWLTLTAIGAGGLVLIGSMKSDISTMARDIGEIKDSMKTDHGLLTQNSMNLAELRVELKAMVTRLEAMEKKVSR